GFRARVSAAYDWRCAITGSVLTPALQAAHIRPYAKGGSHLVNNGLLLRSDVHTLFDQGYLGVTPEFTLRVSDRLRKDSGNGVAYYEMAERGDVICLPERDAEQPDPEALAWHLNEIFRSA
ncbi:MAG TPA: HNH endonuclease, partial [Marmoricola sp.]